MTRVKLSERILPNYTKGEEIFNMVSHIVGGALGVATVVLTIIFAAIKGNVYGVIGGAIFGSSLIVLYTFSSIYHGLKSGTIAKKVFQIFDHCSIFFLIAGSYTPIVLCPIREYNATLCWILFGVVWTAAIIGIVLNSIDIKAYSKFSAICYLAMGWCIVLAWGAAKHLAERGGLGLLVFGGISYTIGAIFYYKFKKTRYMHSIFHLFTLAGSILHSLYVIIYVV